MISTLSMVSIMLFVMCMIVFAEAVNLTRYIAVRKMWFEPALSHIALLVCSFVSVIILLVEIFHGGQ